MPLLSLNMDLPIVELQRFLEKINDELISDPDYALTVRNVQEVILCAGYSDKSKDPPSKVLTDLVEALSTMNYTNDRLQDYAIDCWDSSEILYFADIVKCFVSEIVPQFDLITTARLVILTANAVLGLRHGDKFETS